MNIDEIAALLPQARPPAVPEWTLGCFHRRCITYATGFEDTSTRVIWIQSHGLTGDIRIPAALPDVSGRAGVADLTREELACLALVEGGVADTGFADGHMRWTNWSAFQPYDKWPEPGELRRVGACLLEFAPSGVYVEDWRLQPSAASLLVGLRLMAETLPGQAQRPRDGGLIIAGDHAIFTLGRTSPLPDEAPLPEQVRAAADPAALATVLFECVTHYARRSGAATFQIELSTDPFTGGGRLDLDGFSPGPRPGTLSQTCADGARREWLIDTLLPSRGLSSRTPAQEFGVAWFSREAARLGA